MYRYHITLLKGIENISTTEVDAEDFAGAYAQAKRMAERQDATILRIAEVN